MRSYDREVLAREFLTNRLEVLVVTLLARGPELLAEFKQREPFIARCVEMVEDYVSIRDDGHTVYSRDPRWSMEAKT